MTSSMRSLSRYGLTRPMRLVATILRTVRPRRSGGTRSKSFDGGVRRPGPPRRPEPPELRPPPRKLIAPTVARGRDRHVRERGGARPAEPASPRGDGLVLGDPLGLEPALGVD